MIRLLTSLMKDCAKKETDEAIYKLIKGIYDQYDQVKDDTKPNYGEADAHQFIRFKLTLVSLLAASSFLADLDPTTFYTVTVVLIASSLKFAVFVIPQYMGGQYEITHPEVIIKIVESVYMGRHEKNYLLEEENYRLIVEIMRSPELLKSMTGSSLKGACDPNLDGMNQKHRKKLEHLEKLEQKGFEVQKLKKELLDQYAPKKEHGLLEGYAVRPDEHKEID